MLFRLLFLNTHQAIKCTNITFSLLEPVLSMNYEGNLRYPLPFKKLFENIDFNHMTAMDNDLKAYFKPGRLET